MKPALPTSRPHQRAAGPRVLRLAVMIGALLPFHSTVAAAGDSVHALGDEAACRANLNVIFEAFQEYQKAYQRIPDRLSDLHPEFISDPRRFICPAVQRKGNHATGRAGLRTGVFEDPLPTSYAYEFSLKPYALWAGRSTTCREYKLRQMAVIGVDVPILRCVDENPRIFLSYGGAIFQNVEDKEWEYVFTNRVSIAQLLPPALFKDFAPVPGQPYYPVPARDSDTSPRLLDLSGFYISALDSPWQWNNQSGHDLSGIPQGTVKLDAVPVWFDVRGVIQLNGTNMFAVFPERVDGIPVGQTCQRLHVLHGALNFLYQPDPPGTEIGRYEVVYADGERARIPIIYGRDVLDWGEAGDAPGGPRVAWRKELPPSKTGRPRGYRIYHQEWPNPRPDAVITSLDYISAMTGTAPFLIAITLEP